MHNCFYAEIVTPLGMYTRRGKDLADAVRAVTAVLDTVQAEVGAPMSLYRQGIDYALFRALDGEGPEGVLVSVPEPNSLSGPLKLMICRAEHLDYPIGTSLCHRTYKVATPQSGPFRPRTWWGPRSP